MSHKSRSLRRAASRCVDRLPAPRLAELARSFAIRTSRISRLLSDENLVAFHTEIDGLIFAEREIRRAAALPAHLIAAAISTCPAQALWRAPSRSMAILEPWLPGRARVVTDRPLPLSSSEGSRRELGLRPKHPQAADGRGAWAHSILKKYISEAEGRRVAPTVLRVLASWC